MMIDTSLFTDNAGHLDKGTLVLALSIGGGLIMIIIAIVTDAWRKVSQTRAKEESRREIAAYVAEGSMSADDAAKLLGGNNPCLKTVVKDKIRAAVEKM